MELSPHCWISCINPPDDRQKGISAIWKTEVDGLIENNWIRQILKNFVQAHGL